MTQLVRRGYSQVNFITSASGVSRGGHYHKMNTEAFYIIKGRCRFTAKKDGTEETEEFSVGDFFRIGPYVDHIFEYLEYTERISLYSLGVELDNGEMDTYNVDK